MGYYNKNGYILKKKVGPIQVLNLQLLHEQVKSRVPYSLSQPVTYVKLFLFVVCGLAFEINCHTLNCIKTHSISRLMTKDAHCLSFLIQENIIWIDIK